MKFFVKLTNEGFARRAAQFMRCICYLVICFCTVCMVLSFMGRQSFFLYTKAGAFERAIYAEGNYDAEPLGITVQMSDEIRVWTNDSDQIDPAIQIGLSLMYAANTVPMILAFWFLSRVFSNVRKGQIFTEQNASYLLYYGLLQFSAAIFVPIIKLLICWFTNLASDGRVTIATGQASFNMLVSSTAFIVAAYIIHYGVGLQDEVDHTL